MLSGEVCSPDREASAIQTDLQQVEIPPYSWVNNDGREETEMPNSLYIAGHEFKSDQFIHLDELLELAANMIHPEATDDEIFRTSCYLGGTERRITLMKKEFNRKLYWVHYMYRLALDVNSMRLVSLLLRSDALKGRLVGDLSRRDVSLEELLQPCTSHTEDYSLSEFLSAATTMVKAKYRYVNMLERSLACELGITHYGILANGSIDYSRYIGTGRPLLIDHAFHSAS